MILNKSPLTRALTATAFLLAALVLSGCASREERIQEIQAEASNALYNGDSQFAIETLSEGLSKYPDSNELRIALSRALQNAGNYEESATLLEEAIAFDPEADHLWVKVGELRSALGQSQAAIDALQAYLKNHGDDSLAWKTVALENEKLGRITDAIKAASRWNDLAPSSQPALKLGELYLISRNIPQARSWFSQAAAYGDDFAAKNALANLIKLETSLKQFQQAQAWLQQYQQRYGEDLSDPRIQESKTVLESWEKARREIAEAAAALERERRELENKQIEEERAAADQQAAALETALSTAPTQTEDSADDATDNESLETTVEKAPLALLDDEESETGTALDTETSENVAEEENALQLSGYEEAMLAFESNDFAGAVPQFWELLGETPDDPQIWYRLSQSYYALENWYDAEATILEAKRRAPRSEVIANQYLQTIRKTQNINHVLEEGKALRLLFPQSPTIALTLAQTLRSVQAPRSIVSAAYRDFLSIANRGEPGYQEANQYLQTGN